MSEFVSVEDINARLAVPVGPDQHDRVRVLIGDAVELLRLEFSRVGRDFDNEVEFTDWVGPTARRVVRDMVSAAVIIGGNVGARQVSSTTGPMADSITYADVSSVSFAGIKLLDSHREALGLPIDATPRGWFPRPSCWPEWRW